MRFILHEQEDSFSTKVGQMGLASIASETEIQSRLAVS